MTQIDLATSLVIDRTAMVYLIDELESAASVERVRNPDDRRSFLIYLTRDGRKLQTRAAAALNGAADRLLTPLAESEREQLRHLLSRVATYWQDQPSIRADAARH
jgi:DNA-binding MarR family transcriptional regulator